MVVPDFEKQGGLVPAIVQDYEDGEVLMVGYMNLEAWRTTLETGHVTFWSRSRKKLWTKGEISGHVQKVKEIYIDCDSDAVLIKAEQVGGAACHTGYRSCFYRLVKEGNLQVKGKKIFDPEEVYK